MKEKDTRGRIRVWAGSRGILGSDVGFVGWLKMGPYILTRHDQRQIGQTLQFEI